MDYLVQQELEAEWTAQFDCIHEAYAMEVESVAALKAEAQFYAEEGCIELQDAMEARGGPLPPMPQFDDCPW